MRIAYFTNWYGSASYTFIVTEVEYLRRLGHSVYTFSVRHPGPGEVVSEEVEREQQNTDYFLDPRCLQVNVPRILLAVPRTLLAHPRRSVSALLLALRTSAPGLKARLAQIAYLVMAFHLAERMKARGVEHLHNHLGTSSATIAMLASVLSGIPYSLTIHGGQIFYEPRQWALGEKIVRSAFTLCISNFCRSQCMLFTPHEAWDRLKVVRCSVDEQFLDGQKTPVPESRTLVSVGRLSVEKGHLLLLEAASRVAAVRCGQFWSSESRS
jgi:colanic acid/amylovoran biosynthesis glycosyltransferase